MPSTTTQRKNLTEFMEVTKASRDNAQAFLRNNNYNLDAALNQFYSGHAAGLSKPEDGSANVDGALEAMFDSLEPKANKDELEVEGVMAYCQALNVDMENYEFFVLADIVQVQSFGQITRQGFVKGWRKAWEESRGAVAPDMAAHQKHVRSQIAQVLKDPALFKQVYRSAFAAGKELGKREMAMDVALASWGELFAPTMKRWRTANVDWLQSWTDYLKDKFGVVKVNEDGDEEIEYKRTVSKDLWNQTLLFAEKTLQDDTLGFWSEEQAWPGLIDEFVLWCREKGISRATNGESMEVGE